MLSCDDCTCIVYLYTYYHRVTFVSIVLITHFGCLSDKLVVSTSCSLMHTAVDLINETKLDDEIKSWLAFAAQKVVEVNALAKALAGQKDEVQCFLLRLKYYPNINLI